MILPKVSKNILGHDSRYEIFFSHFCNGVQMVIIHKKTLTIFNYKQVLGLKTCSHPLIIWLLTVKN